MSYKRIPTSAEVFAVIYARHPELRIFGTYTDMGGGTMSTSYGFECGEYPFIGAQITWDHDPENPHIRMNERREYWLCVPTEE